MEAKLDDKYKNIRTATYGLVFFSTPHQGSNRATLGDVIAKIARRVLGNAGNSMLKDLKPKSQFSESLIQDFRHQLEDYRVLSFYETQTYGQLGIVRFYLVFLILLTCVDRRQEFCYSWPSRFSRNSDWVERPPLSNLSI